MKDLHEAVSRHLARIETQGWDQDQFAHNSRTVEESLRRMWGESFDDRMVAIESLPGGYARIRDAIEDDNGSILHDVETLTLLDAVAQRRLRSPA